MFDGEVEAPDKLGGSGDVAVLSEDLYVIVVAAHDGVIFAEGGEEAPGGWAVAWVDGDGFDADVFFDGDDGFVQFVIGVGAGARFRGIEFVGAEVGVRIGMAGDFVAGGVHELPVGPGSHRFGGLSERKNARRGLVVLVIESAGRKEEGEFDVVVFAQLVEAVVGDVGVLRCPLAFDGADHAVA